MKHAEGRGRIGVAGGGGICGDGGMVMWGLFLAAAGLAAVGLLTWVHVPDWVPWRVAVAAGVYGHGLALVAVASGCAAWWLGGWGVAAVAWVGAGLLLRPVMSARRIGERAKEALDAMGAPEDGAAFSWAGLWRGKVKEAAVEVRRMENGLEVDFYRAAGRERAPCVVVVHGGGWDGGDRGQLPELNGWMARKGYAVAAVSYRLAPEHRWPAQREDVWAAIAWVKANAEKLGVDASRLVLLGRSAGGQIALNAAYAARDPAVRGVIALYAPADLFLGYESGREDDALQSRRLLRQYLGGTPEEVPEVYAEASATTHVRGDSPSTLLLHGKLDTLVWERHTARLAERLKAAGVPHAVVWLPWATHAFEYELSGPGGQVTTYAVGRFLGKVVG